MHRPTEWPTDKKLLGHDLFIINRINTIISRSSLKPPKSMVRKLWVKNKGLGLLLFEKMWYKSYASFSYLADTKPMELLGRVKDSRRIDLPAVRLYTIPKDNGAEANGNSQWRLKLGI